MIAGHAALLALKCGPPGQDHLRPRTRTWPRRPSATRRSCATRSALDDGRHARRAGHRRRHRRRRLRRRCRAVVLSRGALHAAGAYDCPNVRVRARVVATNTPPNGAFRGFGAPQTLFAAELQMEKIADALGIDSARAAAEELVHDRRHHRDRPAAARVGRRATSASTSCAKRSKYAAKRKEYDRWNKNARPRRGAASGSRSASTAPASPARARCGSPPGRASR